MTADLAGQIDSLAPASSTVGPAIQGEMSAMAASNWVGSQESAKVRESILSAAPGEGGPVDRMLQEMRASHSDRATAAGPIAGAREATQAQCRRHTGRAIPGD